MESPKMIKQHPALITLLDLRQAAERMDWLDGFDNDSWQGFRADLNYRIRSLEEILQRLREEKNERCDRI